MAQARRPRRAPPRGERPSRAVGIAIGLTAIAVGALGLSALWGRNARAPEPLAALESAEAPAASEAVAPPSGIRVEVLNGSGQEGMGSRVADRLRDAGFQVISVRNADRFDYPRTLVAARGNDIGRARAVARKLAGSQVIRQRSTVDWDVTVVIGRDQARALARP